MLNPSYFLVSAELSFQHVTHRARNQKDAQNKGTVSAQNARSDIPLPIHNTHDFLCWDVLTYSAC